MAEAIISRRGYDASGKPRLITETFITNTSWTVPNDIRGNISIRIFGGGGGGGRRSGGGGGWMNNGEIMINKGEIIQVTIGKGGIGSNGVNGSSGGTSSFGVYMSATGGEGGIYGHGGNGGSGGGSGPFLRLQQHSHHPHAGPDHPGRLL